MSIQFHHLSEIKKRYIIATLFSALLSGCSLFETGMESVKGWYHAKLEENKGKNTNQVIIPVKPLHVISFNADSPNPFDARNLIRVESASELSMNDPNRPDMSRLRQPLESYAISSLAFVGTILQKPPLLNIALIVAAGSLYQVKVGDFLGRNFGQIKEIRDTKVIMTETVKNARNRWELKERVLLLAGLSKENLR